MEKPFEINFQCQCHYDGFSSYTIEEQTGSFIIGLEPDDMTGPHNFQSLCHAFINKMVLNDLISTPCKITIRVEMVKEVVA